MDFAMIGLIIGVIGLSVKLIVGSVIFKRIHGFNVKKFLDAKVLEKRAKISKSEATQKTSS